MCLVLSAGDSVTFTVTATNTGAVRLKNMVLQLPGWAVLANCTSSLPAVVDPHKSLTCHASYTFSQDVYEAGPLSFVAAVKPDELNTSVVSSAAVVQPVYTASLDYHQGPCSLPLSSRALMLCIHVHVLTCIHICWHSHTSA